MISWLGEVRLARLGLLFLAAGLAAVARISNYPTMLVALTLMPVGTAFLFPCVTAMLSRAVPNRERGLYMGVQHTFGGVSRVAFPLMAGYGMDTLGKGMPFLLAGALTLLFVAGYSLIQFLLGVDAPVSPLILRDLIVKTLLNVVLMAPLFLLVRRLLRRALIEGRPRRRAARTTPIGINPA